jgi:VWFA-related protein
MKKLGCVAVCAFLTAAQQGQIVVDEVRVSAHAYTPPQLRLTAQTQLVQLEVVVRDARGRAVGGLRRADFGILDEGKPRPIAAFSVETREPASSLAPASAPAVTPAVVPPAPRPVAPPRSILLFFDDLHGTAGELQRTQLAARRFLESGLGTGARAAVYAASQGLTLDFTADTAQISDAIEKLHSHTRISENGMALCPRIPPYQAYLIANNLDYSAFQAALDEAHACKDADSSLGTQPTGGVVPKGPRLVRSDPTTAVVLGQAEQTWEQARVSSLTSLDALEHALERLARAPGTRVLLMASTGFLSGTLEAERDAAIERAIRAGIVINGLDAKGLWAEPPVRPFGEDAQTVKGFPLSAFLFEAATVGTRVDALNAAMAEFAAATGGLFFHNSNDLAGGFSELGAVPETTYLLAFRPDEQVLGGAYRKLQVRLTAKTGQYIQTRPGYFAPAKAPADTPAEPRKLDTEALASDALAEIPVTLAGRLGKTDLGAPSLSLLIHVDIASLQFAERDGRQTQKLAFIGGLMDSSGRLVAAKEGVMEFALKKETLARLTASGVNATLTLGAPPGPYRVRVVVQEATGKMAALHQVVEIPR